MTLCLIGCFPQEPGLCIDDQHGFKLLTVKRNEYRIFFSAKKKNKNNITCYKIS